jgi:hypothetical protein
MMHSSEVVLPTELQYGSHSVQGYKPVEVEQAWQEIIDLLKESRDITITR